MKKVSIYVKGDRNSTDYYRIYQYLDKLDEKNFHCKYRMQMGEKLYRKWMPVSDKPIYIKILAYLYIYFRRLWGLFFDFLVVPDVLVLHRSFIGRYMPYSFRLLLRGIIYRDTKLVWDFDDHIVANKEVSKRTFDAFAELASCVLVTHDYLKSLLPVSYQDKVIILPTTDGDMYRLFTDKVNLKRLSLLQEQVIMIWVATKRNMRFLKPIIPVLDKTARLLYDLDKRKLVLKVICNERLECDCDNLIIENICWSRQGAIEGMLKAHIGIMPLLDSEFTRGKGGFKLIQYLSIGLPCIGSDVGYNHSIISLECGFLPQTESEWITAIIKLSNILSWKSYSENAFQYWRLNFSYEKNLEVWKALINEP